MLPHVRDMQSLCFASVLPDISPAPKAFGAGLVSEEENAKHVPCRSTSLKSHASLQEDTNSANFVRVAPGMCL